MVDFNQLQRDPERVKSALQASEDGAIIAKRPCAIYVPERWLSHGLLEIGEEIYTVAIYALVVDEKYYALSIVNTMVRVEPSAVNRVYLNEKSYYEFSFEPGDRVIASTEVVKSDKLLYSIFSEIVAQGNVPVYMNYLDLGRLFDTARTYGGVKLATTPTILHMLLSFITRNPDDKSQYFRQITTGDDFDRVSYIQMDSSIYGATNTTARMMGSYFDNNLTSALSRPSESEEDIEALLRG